MAKERVIETSTLTPVSYQLWRKKILIFSFLVFLRHFPHVTSQQSGHHPPSRDVPLEYYIREELPPRSLVGNGIIVDYELDRKYPPVVLNALSFSLLTPAQPAGRRLFVVDEKRGYISTGEMIDRDQICPGADQCIISFDVAVLPIQYFHSIKVKVEIIDINDNIPQFPTGSVSYDLPENTEPGASFLLPVAVDPDGGTNGVQMYILQPFLDPASSSLLSYHPAIAPSPSGQEMFQLSVRNTSAGSSAVHLKIVLMRPLDRETIDSYRLTLVAVDGGDPPLSGSLFVHINVTDVNDNNPEFERISYSVRVPEDAVMGTVIYRISATDRDSGLNGRVRYGFTEETMLDHGDTFGIRNDSGKIFTKSALDFESRQSYTLYVTAVDGDGSVTSLSAMANVLVKVDDVNDNAPVIRVFSRPGGVPVASGPRGGGGAGAGTEGGGGRGVGTPQEHALPAEVAENADVGSFVAHVTVTDADSAAVRGNAAFRCTLINSVEFDLKRLYDTQFVIVTTEKLDREKKDTYEVSIYCADTGSPQLTSELWLNVTVTDVNDNIPHFIEPEYNVSVSETTAPGSGLLRLSATDGDIGQNGHVTYRLMTSDPNDDVSKSVEVDSSTGVLRSRAWFNYDVTSQLQFKVIAEDKGQPIRSSTARVTINIITSNKDRDQEHRTVYEFFVSEGRPGGTVVGRIELGRKGAETRTNGGSRKGSDVRLNGTDSDGGGGGVVARDVSRFYELIHNTDVELFTLDRVTGLLLTRETLDREKEDVYNLEVLALSSTPSSRAHSPIQSPSLSRHSIPLSSSPASRSFPYNSSSSSLRGTLGNQRVTPVRPLPERSPDDYQDVVMRSKVIVHVVDVNDNRPVIEFPNNDNKTVIVPTTVRRNDVIATIVASDADVGENANLTYHLYHVQFDPDQQVPWSREQQLVEGSERLQQLFDVDERLGDVRLGVDIHELNAEELVFLLKVVVVDGGRPSLNATAQLKVILTKTQRLLGHATSFSSSGGAAAGGGGGVSPHTRSILASEDLALVLSCLLAFILLAIAISIAFTFGLRSQQQQQPSSSIHYFKHPPHPVHGSSTSTAPMNGSRATDNKPKLGRDLSTSTRPTAGDDEIKQSLKAAEAAQESGGVVVTDGSKKDRANGDCSGRLPFGRLFRSRNFRSQFFRSSAGCFRPVGGGTGSSTKGLGKGERPGLGGCLQAGNRCGGTRPGLSSVLASTPAEIKAYSGVSHERPHYSIITYNNVHTSCNTEYNPQSVVMTTSASHNKPVVVFVKEHQGPGGTRASTWDDEKGREVEMMQGEVEEETMSGSTRGSTGRGRADTSIYRTLGGGLGNGGFLSPTRTDICRAADSLPRSDPRLNRQTERRDVFPVSPGASHGIDSYMKGMNGGKTNANEEEVEMDCDSSQGHSVQTLMKCSLQQTTGRPDNKRLLDERWILPEASTHSSDRIRFDQSEGLIPAHRSWTQHAHKKSKEWLMSQQEDLTSHDVNSILSDSSLIPLRDGLTRDNSSVDMFKNEDQIIVDPLFQALPGYWATCGPPEPNTLPRYREHQNCIPSAAVGSGNVINISHDDALKVTVSAVHSKGVEYLSEASVTGSNNVTLPRSCDVRTSFRSADCYLLGRAVSENGNV